MGVTAVPLWISDTLYDDPRVEAAGNEALGYLIQCAGRVARQGRSGDVAVEDVTNDALAGRLVAAHLWSLHEDSCTCNPSMLRFGASICLECGDDIPAGTYCPACGRTDLDHAD